MQEKSIIKQNILQYLDFVGSTPYRYYKESGTTRGVLTQTNGISEDNITRFLVHYPEVNSEWLLTGCGEMLKTNNEVLFKSYPKTKTEHKAIPLIGVEVMAGLGKGEFVINDNDVEEFYKVPDFKEADFLVKITGSSMQPKYNNGDVVACKKINLDKIFFQWNRVYVIDTNQGVIIKRICKGLDPEHISIESDNEKYTPFDLHLSEIHSIALVIGVIRLE